jgi:hypothetical protein
MSACVCVIRSSTYLSLLGWLQIRCDCDCIWAAQASLIRLTQSFRIALLEATYVTNKRKVTCHSLCHFREREKMKIEKMTNCLHQLKFVIFLGLAVPFRLEGNACQSRV